MGCAASGQVLIKASTCGDMCELVNQVYASQHRISEGGFMKGAQHNIQVGRHVSFAFAENSPPLENITQ